MSGSTNAAAPSLHALSHGAGAGAGSSGGDNGSSTIRRRLDSGEDGGTSTANGHDSTSGPSPYRGDERREGSQHSHEKPFLHSRSTSGNVPSRGHGLGHGDGSEHGQGGVFQSGSGSRLGRFFAGAHRKAVTRSPWITRPVEGTEEVWVHPDDEATEWLSLFYDLVVVAILNIFSTQHEIGTPAAIPVFLSFFTIIFWTWVSQTAYDMRYQGNDALNRFFKFVQVCLFIYQGAASGNWNPGKIEVWAQNADDRFGTRLSGHQDALRSWLTVVLAFAVSRAVLALQYLICAISGRRAGRRTKHIWITLLALCASAILAVISAAIPSTSYGFKVAKIATFYLGIVIELADNWVQFALRVAPPVETHKIGERYGAILLIVLGEGIISVTKAFNRAISGLSDDDSGTYVQVFLTVLIIYLLWAFNFSNFNKDDHTGHGRAVLWQTLHFPLCFTILLLVSAMVNVIVVLSSAHGVTIVLEYLGALSSSWAAGGGSVALDPNELRRAGRYFNKLSLEPAFADQMDVLADLANQTSPSDDYYVMFDQYAAQIVYSSFQLYGMEISDGATALYRDLYALNTTWTTDELERNHTRHHADELFSEIVGDILNDAFTGVLWLLPVAGCVLILTALRSMAWYRFSGPGHWIIHATQISFGVALGLLGLLDIGPKSFNITEGEFTEDNLDRVNPLYRTLFDEVPLVIVAVVYLVVWLITSGGLILVARRERRRAERGGGDGDGTAAGRGTGTGAGAGANTGVEQAGGFSGGQREKRDGRDGRAGGGGLEVQVSRGEAQV